MRKAVAVAVLVLGAMLLGTLAAGVAEVRSDIATASATAIEHSTTPAPIARVTNLAAVGLRAAAALRPVLAVIQVLLALAALCLAAAWTDVPGGFRTLRLRRSGIRRGPPSPLLATR